MSPFIGEEGRLDIFLKLPSKKQENLNLILFLISKSSAHSRLPPNNVTMLKIYQGISLLIGSDPQDPVTSPKPISFSPKHMDL